MLRYCLDRGICIIPKSVTPARIHENIDVFDFKLEQVGWEVTMREVVLLCVQDEVEALDAQEHRQRLFLQDLYVVEQ